MKHRNRISIPWLSSAYKLGLNTALLIPLVLFSQQTHAHVHYYDLNQGVQISDLTALGKIASTAQYGQTPPAVLTLNSNTQANGIGIISPNSDRPLNDTQFWNDAYQSPAYGVGNFTGVTYTTSSSTATVNVNDVADYGWANGTWITSPGGSGSVPQLLGDSHSVDFFNFRLSQTSNVSITWNVDDGFGYFYDNGFTLYSGVLNYQSHDAASDKLSAGSPFADYVQNALDAVNAPVDAQGIASSYRDTVTNSAFYRGQFNAFGNWGQANGSGNWGNIAYIQAVNNNAGSATGYTTNSADTLETLTIQLAAGNYTIAASGAIGAALSAGGFGNGDLAGTTNLHGLLTYSAVAVVPVPGAIWLFGSVMVSMITMNRRKLSLI